MDQNLMALLASVLSGRGQGLSGGMQARPQPMAQPMAQTTARPMTVQSQPMTGVRPMAGEQPDHGPFTDGDTGHDGGGDKDKDKGGGGGNGGNLSWFEKKMREIGRKGPTAYPKYMQKNLGMNKPTIGYGKADPSTFKTGMASALTGIPDPNAPQKMV